MSEFNLKGCADVKIFYRDWQQEFVGIPIRHIGLGMVVFES